MRREWATLYGTTFLVHTTRVAWYGADPGGSRSGGFHVYPEGRPLVALSAEKRQLPVPVYGLRRIEPNRTLGLYCLRRPLGTRVYIPIRGPPEWLCDFRNREATGLGLMVPSRGIPSVCSRA